MASGQGWVWCGGILACASVAVVGLGNESAAQREPRRPYPARLTVLFSRVSDDRVLVFPHHPVAADSLVYVYDEQQVVAFDYAGALRWRVGRAGAGPGEHRTVSHQVLDHRTGDLWQYDLGNGRIQVRAADGQLRRTYPAPRTLFKVAPLADGRFVATPGGGGGTFLHLFDGTTGAEVRQVPPPVPEYRDPQFSDAASTKLLACPSGHVAVAYAYASYLIVLPPGLGPPVVRESIDPVPPPRSVEISFREGGRTLTGHRRAPDSKLASRSIACDRERLLVLYEGTTGDPGRVVDVYRLSDLAYLGSIRLPESVNFLSMHGDRLVAIRLDPVPALLAWRVTWP